MTEPIRVLHLAGSAVDGFHADLSRLYAGQCLEASLDDPRYDHQVAWVSPDGTWRFPDDLSPAAIAAAPALSRGEALAHLAGLGADVALPQMFCLPGMTAYRSLLEVLDVPMVGNTGDVMAMTAHKARARAVVAAAGVAVPVGEVVRRGERPTVPLPVVVKPADADNSHGVALVRSDDELEPALEAALAWSDEVLVETYVELGREVRCGVLDLGGELVCLPLEEYAVDPVAKPVRDAADKITRTGDDLSLVAKDAAHAWIVPVDDPVTAPVHALARAAHRALGCRDHSLVDVRVDPDGAPYFLEASLYCSFAPSSVLVMMAGAAGVTLPGLLASSIREAVGRRDEPTG